MAQLRHLDAEAAEEQLRELALVGQQAVATLASQARALRAWLGLGLGLGLGLALSLSLSLSLIRSLSPQHLPTHIAHQPTWPLTRARALLAPLHPFAYPPRHTHTLHTLHTLHHTCSPSYVQERVLVTLEAAVRAATKTAASTSAAAEALSRKAPHELTELAHLPT